jgi:hypothetical protein
MPSAVLRTAAAVANRWAAALAVVFAVLGAVREFTSAIPPIPSWAWWLAAIVFLFVAACQIQWDLFRQRENNPASHERIPMHEAARYMARSSTWIRAHHGSRHWFIELQNDLGDALLLGRITAFARDGSPSGSKLKKPLRQIPKEEWGAVMPQTFDGLIGGRGANEAVDAAMSRTVLHDIHLSRDQLRETWPPLPFWQRWRYMSFNRAFDKLSADEVGARHV